MPSVLVAFQSSLLKPERIGRSEFIGQRVRLIRQGIGDLLVRNSHIPPAEHGGSLLQLVDKAWKASGDTSSFSWLLGDRAFSANGRV